MCRDCSGWAPLPTSFRNRLRPGVSSTLMHTLAGGDLRGQLDATLQLRERLVQTGGFVGRGVAFLQDPSGENEAAIRATLSSADAIDARTGRLPGRSLQTSLARARADVAGTGPGYQRAAASINASYAGELMRLDLEQQANARKNTEEVTKDVIAGIANGDYREKIVARAKQLENAGGKRMSGTEWNDALSMAENEIRGDEIRTRTAGRNKADEDATYGPQREFAKRIAAGEMRDLNRERNIQMQLIDRTTKREALVARGLVEAAGRSAIDDDFDAMIARDPASADVLNDLRGERLRAYNAGAGRRRRFNAEDTRDATLANQRMLDRDPLGPGWRGLTTTNAPSHATKNGPTNRNARTRNFSNPNATAFIKTTGTASVTFATNW
jgi:hypothetical protein